MAITYEDGVLRTYINGLVDQYAEAEGLSRDDAYDFKYYNIFTYPAALSSNFIHKNRCIPDNTPARWELR